MMDFYSYLSSDLARLSLNNLIRTINCDFIEVDNGIIDLNNICHFLIINKIECAIVDYINDKNNKKNNENNISNIKNYFCETEIEDGQNSENRTKNIDDYNDPFFKKKSKIYLRF